MAEEKLKYKKVLITEQEREFAITVGEDSFTIRIPTPIGKTQIYTSVARVVGESANALTLDEREYIKMIITLNHVLVNKPEWWEGADKCPDEELLYKLYSFYKKSEEDFQENLKKK